MPDEPGERRRRRDLERARALAAGVPGDAPTAVDDAVPPADDVVPPRGSAADRSARAEEADDGSPSGVAAPAPGEARPLSRRELRERERRLAAAGERTADEAPAAPSSTPSATTPEPETEPEPEPATPGPRAEDLAVRPDDPHRYTAGHYVALVLIGSALGFLVWTLTTGAADPGATSAPSTVPLSLPDLPAAPQGEL